METIKFPLKKNHTIAGCYIIESLSITESTPNSLLQFNGSVGKTCEEKDNRKASGVVAQY